MMTRTEKIIWGIALGVTIGLIVLPWALLVFNNMYK
jgi:hypothetical protein